MKTIFVVGARGIPDAEGGVEKNAEKLFPRLVARGWHVTLAGLKTHIKSAKYRGVKLLSVPTVNILKTDKLPYYFLAFFHAARIRPDIVHMSGLGSALFLWAYRLIGCKTVVRYGSADYLLAKWNLFGRIGFLLAEWQLRHADAIIAVTPALVSRLHARGITGNIHMIPNALDNVGEYTAEPTITLPKNYILSVGRVTGQKNYHLLVSAFEKLETKPADLNLLIVGGLDDKTYLKSLSEQCSENTILTGRLNRRSLGQIYRNAQLFICCSVHEGNSNAVLEAISFQCPLLLSDISENRDLGLDNRHYFDPGDESRLQQAIMQCLANRNVYIAPRNRFSDWDQIADRTEAVYKTISEKPVVEQSSERVRL